MAQKTYGPMHFKKPREPMGKCVECPFTSDQYPQSLLLFVQLKFATKDTYGKEKRENIEIRQVCHVCAELHLRGRIPFPGEKTKPIPSLVIFHDGRYYERTNLGWWRKMDMTNVRVRSK